jgi:hypothetical protein
MAAKLAPALGRARQAALGSPIVTTQVPGEVELASLQGAERRPISEWVTTFQLTLVAIDPYTYESAWILPTATRVLRTFAEADCRTAFLCAADQADTRQFLGPLVEELLVFVDPDREAIKALELETLPALVHIDQACNVVGRAEGWIPAEWRDVSTELARVMSWKRPQLPIPSDPMPFEGTPALTRSPSA